MTIENGVIEEFVRAVKAIHDTGTPNADRVRYTQAIELLKDGPTAESITTAFALAFNTDKFVAHDGWNIINHIINYKWQELSAETRLQIRNEVLKYIISNGNSLVTPASAHLRTAISRVVVSIIELEWPQAWPEMFNQFASIVADSNYMVQCQMVFEILERLIENIYTYVVVENPARRKELQNAINAHAGELIRMVVQRLRLSIQMGNANEEAVLLAKSAIELLSEVFEWVSGKVLAESIDEIVEALCSYLQVETCGIYKTTANSLYKLSSRKRIKNDELPIIVSMFRDQTMQSILTACTLAASSSNTSEEHYTFLKLLCDLLCALGIHLSEIWTYIDKPPDTFNLYLNALTEFFMHPSLYIRAETSQVLLAFSANTSINRSPMLLEKMPTILMTLPKSMERIGWLNDAASQTCQYSRFDYDGESEFLQDFMKLRERCNRLIRENMEQHFDVLSSIITTWVDGRCIGQTSSVTTTEFDSMKRYITCYLQSAIQLEMIKKDVKQWLLMLMDKVFNYLCVLTNPITVNEILSILSALFVILNFEPNRIPSILDLLKRLLSTTETKDGSGNENYDIISLKRHCINLLLKLVTSLPTVIKEYVQLVWDVVIKVAPLVSSMQQASLVQVLAALSNVTDGIDDQKKFLTAALQDVIAFFENGEFNICLTPQGLFNYIGASDSAPTSGEQIHGSAYHLNRVKLKSRLSSIEGALSQVAVPEGRSNPLFEMCLPAIRNVFRFITCLNSIHNDQISAGIHPSYRNGLFSLSSLERRAIIHSSTSGGLDMEESQASNFAQNDAITYMSRFFVEVGDSVQNIVGLVGSRLYYDFYSLPDSQSLIESAFANANYIPDFRLRFWIKRAWGPLISHCPANRAIVVASVTSSLCRHLHALLTARWNVIKNFNENEEDVSEEELFSQQMVSILSGEYANFLTQLIIKSNITFRDDIKKQFEDVMTPLAMELLKDRTVIEPIVATACLLINCPDSRTVCKMIPLAHNIVKSQYTNFDSDMATNLLVHNIRGLQVNGGDEICLGPLLGLAFGIYSTLRPIHPALLNVLEQVPKLPGDVLREFDEKIVNFAYNKPNFNEKNKKDTMKKILRSVIASKVGEEFKRPAPPKLPRS